MSAHPHFGIYRIAVRPRRLLDQDPCETAEKVSKYLSDRRVQFERCGTQGDSAFVDVENKKIPIAMRVLREKRFDPSPPECVQRATVRFPVLIELVLFPRPGREIGDEFSLALDKLIEAELYPFGCSYGAGPGWEEGCGAFHVEDFNLEATLQVFKAGGFDVQLSQ